MKNVHKMLGEGIGGKEWGEGVLGKNRKINSLFINVQNVSKYPITNHFH